MQLLFKKSRSPSGDRARLCALRKLVKNNNNIKQSIEKIPRGFCEFSVAIMNKAKEGTQMNEVAVDTATDGFWTDRSVKSSRSAPLPESDSRSYLMWDSAGKPFYRKA